MTCDKCKVIKRCINDGDRFGAAKWVPCSRDSFYDPTHNFCDRENCKAFSCYQCLKSICKTTDACQHESLNKAGCV